MLDSGEWSGRESPAKLWQTCATADAYGDPRVSDQRSGDDLLHQLRIDRALRGQATTVETSMAVATASSSDAAVLQATGYVVARRQATISAQIIGTLTQVSVDEGAHVKQGQVMARLDPTAYQAQLDSMQAQ